MSGRIQAIPNISEARRPSVAEAIAEVFAASPGVSLIDVSSDVCHNRTVLTAVAPEERWETACLRLFEAAIQNIDLRQHRGQHPRIGAVDVLPFVPLEGATMEACVALAQRVGRLVAERFQLPIFLYERAAARPERSELSHIRQGGFEGLAEKLKDPFWSPDFGPPVPHPTAGAAVVGARDVLVAFNVNLGTDRMEVARAIARAVRHRDGGLRFVKAMAIDLAPRGIVQVSMNLTDYRKTPLHRVHGLIRQEAGRYGVPVVGSEIVGLAPLDALLDAAEHHLQIEGRAREHVLEEKLRNRSS